MAKPTRSEWRAIVDFGDQLLRELESADAPLERVIERTVVEQPVTRVVERLIHEVPVEIVREVHHHHTVETVRELGTVETRIVEKPTIQRVVEKVVQPFKPLAAPASRLEVQAVAKRLTDLESRPAPALEVGRADLDGLSGRVKQELDTIWDALAQRAQGSWTPQWSNLVGKPDTFPPAPHTHPSTDLQAWPSQAETDRIVNGFLVDPKAHTHDSADLDAWPSQAETDRILNGWLATPKAHTHPSSDLQAWPNQAEADRIIAGFTANPKAHTHASADLDAWPSQAEADRIIAGFTANPKAHTHPVSDITSLFDGTAPTRLTTAEAVGASTTAAHRDHAHGSGLTAGHIAFSTGPSAGLAGEAELFWDTGNNRLGIGTAGPATSLHISTSAAFPGIRIESTISAAQASLSLINADRNWILYVDGFTSNDPLQFRDSTAGVTRMTLYEGLQIGAPTGGDKGAGTLNLATAYYKNNAILAQLLGSAPNLVVNASSTEFYGIGHNGSAFAAAEASVEMDVPAAGTIRSLRVRTSAAQPASGSLVITLRKNGADQAVTLTIAAGAAAGAFSDTTNSFTVAAGDRICVKLVNNATANSAKISGIAMNLEIG